MTERVKMEELKVTKNNDLREKEKSLRRNMTRQEKHLWYDFLRNYPIKIYKQRIIDNYIVDFYCNKARLVIELDGSQHYTEDGVAYDTVRTEIIEKYDLHVVRFSNRDIDYNFDGVCQMIDRIIKSRVE